MPSTSSISTSRPSGVAMSRPMARLPRLFSSKMWAMPSTFAGTPQAAVLREGSPARGCSTFSTSAPQSARMAPAAGTKT